MLRKKVLGLGLAGLMSLSLAACGGAEEQSVTLNYEMEGVTMEYTLDATGDIVHTITQVSSVDCSAYTEEQVAVLQSSLEEYATVYEAYEGVEYSSSVEEGFMYETIKIDVTDQDTISELSEAGLLPIEGDSAITFISLEKTVESLESQGWVVQE